MTKSYRTRAFRDDVGIWKAFSGRLYAFDAPTGADFR